MTALNYIKLLWQGLDGFEAVLKKQMNLVEKVQQGGDPVVVGCEHLTVITFGKRSQNFNDLLIPLSQLRNENIEIFTIDRGGHATLHNPGQLVLYPIIPIKRMGIGVRAFVECLELATALFLAENGLEATRSTEPGLWVGGKKIAAFGIRVDRGVTLHGLAINVCNDLGAFNLVKQCGVQTQATSMESEMSQFMGASPPFHLEDMARQWTRCFEECLREVMQSTGNPENSVVQEPHIGA